MSRYGLERHNETLLRLGERWQQALDDQRPKADAGNHSERECSAPSSGAASRAPINRHVDTERDG